MGHPDTPHEAPAHAHPSSAEADALARRVGQAMFAADTASKDTLGLELLSCQPGRATMRMTVRPLHLNGHQICHGGFIFTLADSTFAYACNSRNHNTVANGCSIEFLRPAHQGDELTAEGVEQSLAGRHGVYDIRVRNQKGQTVALFRGKSTQISGTVVPVAQAD
jgi:acyl-CoA thioesterase